MAITLENDACDGCSAECLPAFEMIAKQIAPTPQMIATGNAKQQSVRIAKIPLIRDIAANEFFSRLGRCG